MQLTRASLLLLMCCCRCSGHTAAADALADSSSASANNTSGPPRVHANAPTDVASSGANQSASSTAATFDAPKDQALWLDRHNWLRSDGLVWPAADMAQLGWDFTLAAEARTAIGSCLQQPKDAQGLLVFVDSTPGRAVDASLIEQAIASWGLHELFETIPRLEPPLQPGDAVGKGLYSRYSQLVWAKTTRVGCAYTICAQGRLAACKYSPTSNTPGLGWYEFGAPCSRCAGASCAAGLCVDGTGSSSSQQTEGAVRTVTLPAQEQAAGLYLTHKVRSLQLALDAVMSKRRGGSGESVTAVAALGSNATIGTLCNGTAGTTITQEQLSMLNLDGGLSPLAVVFGLFLGVSVILVMIVCIMHATKPKKRETPNEQPDGVGGSAGAQSPDKDADDECVQVI